MSHWSSFIDAFTRNDELTNSNQIQNRWKGGIRNVIESMIQWRRLATGNQPFICDRILPLTFFSGEMNRKMTYAIRIHFVHFRMKHKLPRSFSDHAIVSGHHMVVHFGISLMSELWNVCRHWWLVNKLSVHKSQNSVERYASDTQAKNTSPIHTSAWSITSIWYLLKSISFMRKTRKYGKNEKNGRELEKTSINFLWNPIFFRRLIVICFSYSRKTGVFLFRSRKCDLYQSSIFQTLFLSLMKYETITTLPPIKGQLFGSIHETKWHTHTHTQFWCILNHRM